MCFFHFPFFLLSPLPPPLSSLVSSSPVVCAVNLNPCFTLLWTLPVQFNLFSLSFCYYPQKESMARLLVVLFFQGRQFCVNYYLETYLHILCSVFIFIWHRFKDFKLIKNNRSLNKNENEWTIKHNLFKSCNLWFKLIKMLLSGIFKILRFLKFDFSLRHLQISYLIKE